MRHAGGRNAPWLGQVKSSIAEADQKRLNVLIIQRPKGLGRHIANLDHVMTWFKHNQFGGNFDVTVYAPEMDPAQINLTVADWDRFMFVKQMDDHGPAHQVLDAARYDILIGAHGSALSFGIFMHKGVIIELLPTMNMLFKTICEPGWNRNKYTVNTTKSQNLLMQQTKFWFQK